MPHGGSSTGEVVVRAPWLTQGYLEDPEQSEMLWRDGWLHTGDVGFIDPEGYLQFADRIKDVIKTGGEWISSRAPEDLISQHEGVSEATVIGVDGEKWGERPPALIVPKKDWRGKLDESAWKDYFKQAAEKGIIPRHGIPDRVVFGDAIAKTSAGKINSKELRHQFGPPHATRKESP